ncbi:PREDICTED: uncharacterized protein LOC104715265 [Camelina sativa]|uniref:Uncharacterized protein LOC104715265 n=1 Tax=Camelina sativa TaxID=90675 RepID=A0ABM0TT78_CAMSA|nr:PREDICTED: uncharacterized protein LOC104715265 [Camelina sativa]
MSDSVPTSETEAYFDGEGSPQKSNPGESEEDATIGDFEFRKSLRDAETPLYATCSNYTKVSAIMALYQIKVKSGLSENFFDHILTIVHDMLPKDNVLPKSTDAIKKFMKVFGFGYDVIHACKNDCILYRKQFGEMESCPRCSASRWEIDKQSGEEKKGIPGKVLRYFPVKDRFRRMFRSKKGLRIYVGIIPMPPKMAKNIMLTMLIPGPTAPSNNIDVYLAPLIDDLKDLWNEGLDVYDSYLEEHFTFRALLLWTISDYPALGTLSGCKVKGKQACSVRGKDTPTRWLKFSRWFDNTVEEGTANRIQTGPEIFETLKDFRNDFGRPLDKETKRKRTEMLADEEISEEECEETSDQWRWKKRSILYDLPYWKELPVRHNINVMHNLLPAALRGLLPRGPRVLVTRLCNFFNRLCQRTIDPEKLLSLEFEIVETMCQLERYMKILKAYVKNYARPEACMAEGYLAGECIAFCLEFLKKSVHVQEAVNRNEDIETDGLVVEGRSLQKGREVTLSDREREVAHRYVLMNLAIMDPYVQMHLEELQAKDVRCARSETILSNSKDHSKKLMWLAFGPKYIAQAHKGFVINGHRFHTDDVKRKT